MNMYRSVILRIGNVCREIQNTHFTYLQYSFFSKILSIIKYCPKMW